MAKKMLKNKEKYWVFIYDLLYYIILLNSLYEYIDVQ